MNVRATIIVKGRVNGVGYREIVDERAFPLELSGCVRELAEGHVEVVCEGEQEIIQAFIKRISLVKYPVRVTGVEVRYSEAKGEFNDFRILRDGGPLSELCERLESAMRSVREIQAELASQQDGRELLSRLLVVQHKALERLDRSARIDAQLLEDQTRMVKRQEVVARAAAGALATAERLLKKQESTLAAIRALDHHEDERSSRLCRRLDRIAAALSSLTMAPGAKRRANRRRRPRTNEAAASDPVAPAAVEGGLAEASAGNAGMAEGGVAG